MPRMIARNAATLAIASVLLTSCVCVDEDLKEAQTCNWVLACVHLDASLVHNAGALPIYRRSDGYSFGSEPVALGTMQGSTEGLWSIQVRFRESVVAFSGRSGMHEYDVLSLSGKCKQGSNCIASQAAIPNDVAVGVATEVYVTRISKTRMRVQPATRGQKLPYSFTFDSTIPQPRPVAVPLL